MVLTPFGTHGRDKQRYPRADVGRGHVHTAQVKTAVQPYHNGTVRITQDNLCSHINQLIHKEETAFEHLLVYQDTACGLGGDDQHHTEQVGGESRPGRIGNGEDGSVDE